MATGHPDDGLDVAQGARGALEVGLQVVFRRTVLAVSLLLLLAFGGKVIPVRERIAGIDALPKGLRSFFISGDQSGFQQVGEDGDVVARGGHTLLDTAHAVPDIQTQVPEQGQESGKCFLVRLGTGLARQDQQVDVRIGMQLPPAVAANRHQRKIVRLAQRGVLPEQPQNDVHDAGAPMHQRAHIGTGAELVRHDLLQAFKVATNRNPGGGRIADFLGQGRGIQMLFRVKEGAGRGHRKRTPR